MLGYSLDERHLGRHLGESIGQGRDALDLLGRLGQRGKPVEIARVERPRRVAQGERHRARRERDGVARPRRAAGGGQRRLLVAEPGITEADERATARLAGRQGAQRGQRSDGGQHDHGVRAGQPRDLAIVREEGARLRRQRRGPGRQQGQRQLAERAVGDDEDDAGIVPAYRRDLRPVAEPGMLMAVERISAATIVTPSGLHGAKRQEPTP